MKKIGLAFLVMNLSIIGKLRSQILASFSFSQQATSGYGYSDAGWTNVHGDPLTAVRTATANGITISSVSTANWVSDESICAEDGTGVSSGTFFPVHILADHWYQFSASGLATYNQAYPQLELSGLNKDSFYILRMSANSQYVVGDPTQYTVAGRTVAPSQDVNPYHNTATGVTFQHIYPDSNGVIKIYVNTTAGNSVAYLAGVQVISGSSTVGIPVVSITSPDNNDVLAEESNITINASASETGGSITKVEFFADTIKIGEDDSAPYAMTWANPSEGNYTITARATDASGTASSAIIHISVQSLTSFWSMTGNVNMNPDSNFVGNVDSVRLAFRTKNIERMSISPNGNVGIGTINPTAQLHTTGTTRFSGLTADSTKTRVLVSDTSGNLYYRNVSSLGTPNHWQVIGGTVYDSADNIGIGTSNTQGYKLAVNGTAIFTKVKVKTAGTWPDYVFQKGYALTDLTELERYISLHKHLPGIIPESEAGREGIDVASQESALLKKVEELTLYLIDENKKLKEQCRKLEDQNRKIERQEEEIDELKQLIKEKNRNK
jgi:Bacterial Ig domain